MLKQNFHAAAIVAGFASACITGMPASASTARPVFVCRSARLVIFSDRPCGPVAEARVLHVHDPGPGQPASLDPAPTGASTRPQVGRQSAEAVADAGPSADDDRCRGLRQQREQLDDLTPAGGS
jgi:hypothetical protein